MSTVSKASARKAGVDRVELNEASLHDQALSPQPRPLCHMDTPRVARQRLDMLLMPSSALVYQLTWANGRASPAVYLSFPVDILIYAA